MMNDKTKCDISYFGIVFGYYLERNSDTYHKVMNLETLMLSKRNQIQRFTNCMIPFIGNNRE